MKRETLCLIIFFACTIQTFSQKNKKINLVLDNSSLVEAIHLIEQKTNFKFFYINNWLSSNKINITSNFNNKKIDEILNQILKSTDLNFYILDETNIILTKNNQIHKSTYKIVNIDSINTESAIQEDVKPIYIPQLTSSKKNRNKIYRIGKETNRNSNKSYRLKGYVKNHTTGEPINNLVLLIKNKNIYTSTDRNGYYSFRVPFGYNEMEAMLLGYEKSNFKIILYSDGEFNFDIKENTESLDEIVISANARQNVKSVISGVNQIEAEEIKVIPQVLGERDLLKIATTLPGVVSAGEGADGVNVRGGKVDQNLFLLDNSVLYNSTHFLGLFSAINPFTTKDFKVYKGNVPSEFGGRISSVFDVSTKTSSFEEFSGEASVGPVTSNISLNIPIISKKSSLLLAGRSTYSDWILKALKNERLNKSSAFFFDGYLKYTHKLDSLNTITASTYLSSDSYSIASDSTNSYQNQIISLNWKRILNDKSNLNLLLSNSSYGFNIDYDGNSNKNFNLKYKINESNVKFKINYTPSNKHSLNFGIASKLYQVNPGEITPNGKNSIITPFKVQNEKALESALFINDDYNISKKLSVNTGVRYNVYFALGGLTQRVYDPSLPKSDASVISINNYKNNEVYKTYHGLSMRLSSRYSINNDLSLKASLHNSYQFIHRLTNNTSASPTDIWKLSDLNIKPQKAIQATLGLFKNIDGNAYEFSIETYYKKYENILNYKVGANLLLNEFIETEVLQGPGKSYGAELLFKKNIGKLNGWLSYSYSKSLLRLDSKFAQERVNNGRLFPTNFDKPHNLNLIANYKLTKRFSLSSNFTFQSGRPVTFPAGKYIYQGNEYTFYGDVNKYRIPSYYRLDIGFNAEGNHKLKKIGHSFWNFSIYNVLGKNNPYSMFFTTENGEIKAYQSSIFSTPIPTITYNFKF
jgi:hypothetical protein